MQETFTIDEYIRFLSLAPADLLERVGNGLTVTLKHLSDEHHPDAESVAVMLIMLGREYELRQIEPLWRKAQRFAIRNSEAFKEIGKVAACVGAGALLGVSLDNS